VFNTHWQLQLIGTLCREYAKTAELIEPQFGMLIRVGRGYVY